MKPAIFLHIQKTAGTAIVEIFKQRLSPNQLISHGDFISRSPKELEALQFISGHFGFKYAENLIATRYSFTFLREPIERVLSVYYFCRSQNSEQFPIYKLAKNLPLENLLK